MFVLPGFLSLSLVLYHGTFVLTGSPLDFLHSFFFLVSLKPFYCTVGLVLIFPTAAMTKEYADKHIITLRMEEKEVKYENTVLNLSKIFR